MSSNAPFGKLWSLLIVFAITISWNCYSIAQPVIDASTLNHKVLCGYQGWFNTPSDGADRGYIHWGRARLEPGQWTVDMLPDVSEFDADELHDTATSFADGKPVRVFSSYNVKTVSRHFKWMQDYGIDGVFLQRFANGLGEASTMRHYGRVVQNVRDGARTYGRVWGMMYDLSGLKAGEIDKVIDDWKTLRDRDQITSDKQYIRHDGKPVVVIWGIGFGNGTPKERPDLFEDGLKLVNFLKSDSVYGNNTVMIGVPADWRQRLERDPNHAEAFNKVLLATDIIQPWSVGSYASIDDAVHIARTRWADDLKWCQSNGRQYMPVVFPGFTWYNLRHGRTPSDQIPRLGGRFLWTQYVEAHRLGLPLLYQAMFDEVDEGTAIFKITDQLPPPGKSVFVGTHGLPSDFYLKLVGQGTKLIRNEIKPEDEALLNKDQGPGQHSDRR